MADRNTKIQIPERREDEPPATAEQLARIRQLTAGQSLQGYRFDYRKLGSDQANAILQQLNAMNDQQPTPARKRGPGCIASLAKGTTALIFWALVLAGVAGGGYLIYNHINTNPRSATGPDDNTPDPQASATDTPSPPDNPKRNTGTSTIFEGLGTSDPPAPRPDPPDTPDTTAPTEPAPEPDPPPTPAVDRELMQQVRDLEAMLVTLSQSTRKDFAAEVRTLSAQAMQNKLDALPRALSALETTDPTLPPRIRAAIDAFAAPSFDGPALRDEIDRIRATLDTLQ